MQTDHPMQPGQPEILQLSDNTCILRWDEPKDDGKNNAIILHTL